MLYLYDKKTKSFIPSTETDFKTHELMERRDLEKWILNYPDILGEELMIITTEYDKFDKTKERLDLLALDKDGKLVVIELKRDETTKAVELQAIKYAAYCSTLTMDDLIELRKEFIEKSGKIRGIEEIKEELFDFIENEDFEKLDDKPRIILAAKEFRQEVTATVLWLRKFGVDISCVKLIPYKLDDEKIGIISSKIIPLPEVEDYMIKSERKERLEGLTERQRSYLKFFEELRQEIRDFISNVPEPYPRSYYQILTRLHGVHFEWSFRGRTQLSLEIGLHFERSEKEENKKLIESLKKYQDEIEKECGEKVIFQEDWGKKWSRIYIEKSDAYMNEELKKWAVEKMKIFYRLLNPKLESLN